MTRLLGALDAIGAGQTIQVRLPSRADRDGFNAFPPFHGDPVDVHGVLVCPLESSEFGPERPDGATVGYTLHFPKSWSGSLRGALAIVDGEELEVVGDPRPYPPGAVPGPWNMPVKVVRHEG